MPGIVLGKTSTIATATSSTSFVRAARSLLVIRRKASVNASLFLESSYEMGDKVCTKHSQILFAVISVGKSTSATGHAIRLVRITPESDVACSDLR